MSPQRHFLGLEQPPMAAAVDWLLAHSGTASGDLHGMLVGVSGGRAAGRLTELLARHAESRGLILRPPTLLTAESLANRLLPVGLPIVPQPLRLLAWVQALRIQSHQGLSRLTAEPPEPDDAASWASLAEMIESMHTELSSAGLRFSDVPARGEVLSDFQDGHRWEALSVIYEQYLQVLGQWGYADPNESRLCAQVKGVRDPGAPIVLVGMADVNPVLSGLLDQCASPCTVLIAAESKDADQFDAWGRPVPTVWSQAVIELDDAWIHVVEEPADQADQMIRALAELKGQWPAESITLGLADAELGPMVRQHLAAAGLKLRDAHARHLKQTGAYQCLHAFAQVLADPTIEALQALLRHPDIEQALTRHGDESHDHSLLLADLDRLALDTLIQRWDAQTRWPASILPAMQIIASWLSPLQADAQPMHTWAAPILQLLVAIYGGDVLDMEREQDVEHRAALEILRDALQAWQEKPLEPMPFAGRAAEAIGFILRSVATRDLEPPADAKAIEAMRWIELPLDDAPVTLVVGLNEGAVPRAHRPHPFLTERLRSVLGLTDASMRYAQDAHAMHVLSKTRQVVKLIAGRRGVDGGPRMPSRLLMAASPDQVARRVLRFFPERAPRVIRHLDRRLQSAQTSIFTDGQSWPPRPPEDAMCPEPISVTAFRDYIACRYRFYLRHVLKLEPVEEPALEMNARVFGTLAHDVLAAFGRQGPHDSEDPLVIARDLSDRLNGHFVQQFGADPAPALQVQREQLRRRLESFAPWQAQRAAEGWRIRAIELKVSRAELPGLQPALGIHGRIDRIDFNERTGAWAILDYKTGDHGQTPEKVHRAHGEWVDLQLPLYRHLARAKKLATEGDVQLGYAILSAHVQEAGARFAEWTEDDLAQADRRALEVGQAIRDRRFYPPESPPRFDPYASICGAEQFLELGPIDLSDEEEGAA